VTGVVTGAVSGVSINVGVDVPADADEEETAAIVAAVLALLPRPGVAGAAPAAPPERWRFSGRWWAKPVSARRDRPGPFG
jgi:hypothetical protein